MPDDRGPKERLYDEKISPLMAQIIALCKEAKINMVADFALDVIDGDPLYCSTAMTNVDPEDKKSAAKYAKVVKILKDRPELFAITVISGSKADKGPAS